MKKRFFAALLSALALFVFAACAFKSGDCVAVLRSVREERVVIYVEETDGKATLLDALNYVKGPTFTFMEEGGMIVVVNELQQNEHSRHYWLIFTSDEEFSSKAFGSTSYGDGYIDSATCGVRDLIVKQGEVYILEYTQF